MESVGFLRYSHGTSFQTPGPKDGAPIHNRDLTLIWDSVIGSISLREAFASFHVIIVVDVVVVLVVLSLRQCLVCQVRRSGYEQNVFIISAVH